MRNIKPQANLVRRILAILADYVLFFALFYFFVRTVGEPNDTGGYSVYGLPALAPMVFWFIYFPIIESFNGQTLGHKLPGLMVIDQSGRKVDLGKTLVRRLFDPVDMFFFGLVGILCITNNVLHQRVGDLVAKTIVIGKETQRCPACRTELTLEAEETLKGEFECPECGTTTALTT